jgi:hypothetical protein
VDFGDPHSISQGSHQVSGRGRMATALHRNPTAERKKSCFSNNTSNKYIKRCSIDGKAPAPNSNQTPDLGGHVDSDNNKKQIVPAEEDWVGGINVSRILAYREEAYQKKTTENLIIEETGLGGKDIDIKIGDKKDVESISVSMPDSSQMTPGMQNGDLGD